MGGDDAELIERWREGDEEAFESLVGRFGGPLARFLARLAGDDEAADLTQEVFLRVYQARGKYRENGAFSSWLYRIALNVARDAARQKRRRPDATAHAGVPRAGDDSKSGDERFQNAQRRRAVQSALAELPAELREVLVLRHYEDQSFEAMSRLLEVPASTLKSRFATALEQLRRVLKKQGWLEEDLRG